MRGCRVIDVASDEFDKFLDRASQLHHAKLLAKLPNGLSEEEHSIIVLDFGVLKSNLFSAAGLRTKEFKRIPNRTFAMGVVEVPKAIAFGAECLLQYAQLPRRLQLKAHPRIQEFFEFGTPFYLEFVEAMRTLSLQPGGLIEHLRAKQQFAKSLEIEIEQRHAQTQQSVAKMHHYGEAIISCCNRKVEILSHTKSADGADSFLNNMSRCFSGCRCIGSLGMKLHPSAQAYVKPGGSLDRRFPEGLCQRIIYNNDTRRHFATFKIVLTTTEVMTMTTTATMEEVLRRLAMEEVLRQGRLRQGMTMAPLHRHHRHHRRPAVMIAMVMGAKNLWRD